MSIKYVILGFLSEMPMSGYDLKKKFSTSDIFYWSGNNNQIYKTLVELHNDLLVTVEVHYQESKPPRKLYTITDSGRAVLRQWIQSPPALPQFHTQLMIQLNWADELIPHELNELLATYRDELQAHITIIREQVNRNKANMPSKWIAHQSANHWLSFYEHELNWVHNLIQNLNDTRKEIP